VCISKDHSLVAYLENPAGNTAIYKDYKACVTLTFRIALTLRVSLTFRVSLTPSQPSPILERGLRTRESQNGGSLDGLDWLVVWLDGLTGWTGN
jgi:hypothetical protein